MGSPISRIITEIYLCYKNMFIKHILESKNIVFYTTYVYDTLIIYNKTLNNPDLMKTNMNHIHKNITFKPTPKTTIQILPWFIPHMENILPPHIQPSISFQIIPQNIQ
jgi:hypothetical protein